VEQQIQPACGNSNGGVVFGKSGKVVVKQGKTVSDNPATSANNPPGGCWQKIKMPSRKK